jgi:hypothetical protein
MIGLVLIGMLKFLGFKSKSMQSFSQACFPFPNFFGHVMHSSMLAWAILIDVYHPWGTFSLVVTYWQTFNKTWSKHDPSNKCLQHSQIITWNNQIQSTCTSMQIISPYHKQGFRAQSCHKNKVLVKRCKKSKK